MPFQYPAIENESTFEHFITDLFNAIHETHSFQLYKTKGAQQHGVDIFSTEKKIVIQCKKKDRSRPEKILKNELISDFDNSLELIKELPFSFETFILASTTNKFSVVQDYAASLTNSKGFEVQFLSWTEIQRHIHKYENIQKEYYPSFSKKNNITKIQPPIGTIGANALLKKTIQDKFKKLGGERAKRLLQEKLKKTRLQLFDIKELEKKCSKSAHSVVYKNCFINFGVKNLSDIWLWSKHKAPPLIQYLDEKYANTIAGRKENAAKKESYVPERFQLYIEEKELLRHLGLKMDSPNVREEMLKNFGVSSHRDLTHQQHWDFVCFWESKVKKLENSESSE